MILDTFAKHLEEKREKALFLFFFPIDQVPAYVSDKFIFLFLLAGESLLCVLAESATAYTISIYRNLYLILINTYVNVS